MVHPEVRVKVSFEEGSSAIDIDTRIEFEDRQYYKVDPAMYDFIRQYGCSVTTLVVPRSFDDPLAKLLDESIQQKSSRIVRLDLTPSSLTTPGLDAMSQVIDRSQDLTFLRLNFERLDNQLTMAYNLLRQHKDRLTSLRLAGF
jgi:hypothetical protein